MLDGLIISVDVMGGDEAPDIVIQGIEYFLKHAGKGRQARFLLHGDEAEINRLLTKAPQTRERSEIRHTPDVIAMDAKPSAAMRRGKGTSMWNAVEAVKQGDAKVAISAGNTGALMAMSKLLLRMKRACNVLLLPRDGRAKRAMGFYWMLARTLSVMPINCVNLQSSARRITARFIKKTNPALVF